MHVIRSSAMPSIGMLTGFSSDVTEYSNKVVEYLRNNSPKNNYFGSEHDRYYETFTRMNQPFLENVFTTNRILRSVSATILQPKGIMALTNAIALASPTPEMYIPILSHPEVYRLLRNGRIQGYADYTAKMIEPYAKMYKRIILDNGSVTNDLYVEDADMNQDVVITVQDDDPNLTEREIQDIKDTWNYIDLVLETTDLDPTCLTQLRG